MATIGAPYKASSVKSVKLVVNIVILTADAIDLRIVPFGVFRMGYSEKTCPVYPPV